MVPGAVGSAVGGRAGSSCSCLPRSCCPCGCLGPVWGTAGSSLLSGAQLKGLLARSKRSSPVPLLPRATLGCPHHAALGALGAVSAGRALPVPVGIVALWFCVRGLFLVGPQWSWTRRSSQARGIPCRCVLRDVRGALPLLRQICLCDSPPGLGGAVGVLAGSRQLWGDTKNTPGAAAGRCPVPRGGRAARAVFRPWVSAGAAAL